MPQPMISPETVTVERNQSVPLYRVVLLDDNDHTYDYVIEMLQAIFVLSLDQAYRHAEQAKGFHRAGCRASVSGVLKALALHKFPR